jgi:hypothetical protein
VVSKLKSIFLIFFGVILFLLTSQSLFAQERNKEVRELNKIVGMMNAFSRCNQQWYFDAVQLQKALFMSSEKINENYFYCSKTQRNGVISYSGIEAVFRFPEITPTAQKQIPAYQADYIPWLEAKELVAKSHLNQKSNYVALATILERYIASSDSLFEVHNRLNNYISDKIFRSDNGFQQAQNILKSHEYWFKSCYVASRELDSVLFNYYTTQFPPLTTHKELQKGLEELNLTMKLLTTWETE